MPDMATEFYARLYGKGKEQPQEKEQIEAPISLEAALAIEII